VEKGRGMYSAHFSTPADHQGAHGIELTAKYMIFSFLTFFRQAKVYLRMALFFSDFFWEYLWIRATFWRKKILLLLLFWYPGPAKCGY
jgi:hypothetical protein